MSNLEQAGDEKRARAVDGLTRGVLIGVPLVLFAISAWAHGSGPSTDGTVGAFGRGPSHPPAAAFPWAIVGELALVVYAYSAAARRREWRAVHLGLTVWCGEFIWEMVNGLVRHWHCYPLFGFQGQTAWQLYPGLTIEISLMFAVAPLVLFHLLPEDPEERILGLRSRLLVPTSLGLFCVLVEVSLNRAGALVWTWWFWRWPHIGLVMVAYCGPFLLMAWAYDRLKDKGTWSRNLLLGMAAAAVACHLALPHSSEPVRDCPVSTMDAPTPSR